MAKVFIVLGAIFGFFSVALGAFGAHALKSRLPAGMMDIYQTGIQYQSIHSLALVLTGVLILIIPGKISWLNYSGWFFLVGIVIFSGSLYILSLTGIKTLGAVTPFGGLAFLAGWACLIIGALTGIKQ